jgi:hypothetical protein
MRQTGEGLSSDEARDIAKRILADVENSIEGPGSETKRDLSPEDEDRVEAALIELGAADADQTSMAEGPPS